MYSFYYVNYITFEILSKMTFTSFCRTHAFNRDARVFGEGGKETGGEMRGGGVSLAQQ